MAKFVFGMNLSLDGYVDHEEFAPDAMLFRHWIEQVGGIAGCLYGRRIYELMRYWDDDQPEWTADEHDFAAAWRSRPKWVVSRSLTSVGPNATLVQTISRRRSDGSKRRSTARSTSPARTSPDALPNWASSTNTGSITTRWCWVGARRFLPGRVRGCACWRATGLGRV